MIPIMPRQSSDDDRPMGLKFTRNNFFGFSKGEIKRTPSSAKKYEEKEKNNRDSDSSLTQLSPIASPTIPTRSPFRIRDSQASAQNMSQSNSSHGYNNNIQQSNHYGSPTQNVNSSYNNTNYNNSNSKNSITSSHAKEPSTYSISSDSSSVSTDDDLTHELESIWKLKSSKVTLSQEIQKKSFSSDDMLMQLLVSHAVVDSREFKVLSFEEFEALKQNYARLKNQVQVSTSKLQLDKKIQETSHTLTQLSSPTNHYRESVLILRDEALEADKKVALLSEKLNQLKEQEAQVQYQILQHTAGVLALGLHKLEKQKSTQGAGAGGHYVANKESQHTGQVDHEHVDRLQSEIQQMTHSLNALLKRHDQDELNTMPTAELVLDRIEQRLNAYKADTKQLENKVEAAEERIRLENMAGKKMEIQLKAIQDKRDVAQQKIHDLESEIEKLHEAAAQKTSNNTNFDFNLESLQADMNNLNFEDDSNQKMTDLESELDTTVQHLHRVQAELKGGQAELGTLKIMISDLEVASSKAQSQATVYQNREKALKSEMEQYRDEVFGLRSEKEKWEKTMKRQTFMQMMDNNGPSMTEKYEQQLEEQEQEYRAQLKEQAAFLDKTSRQCESLQQEHDKLATTCKDLEDLIRDKTRALDARDVQITRLEQEKKQEMKQEMKHSPVDGATARSMKELQDAFSTKEAQWIEQSAAMEANFEGIMREFDRLTGTAMEFETDKMNYERRIESLTGQVKTLETNLNEEKVKNLGFQGDTPTTASLRREFRKMINDLKADHERVLEREADEKKKLEKQLKDLKHEKDMSRYERVNIGVQTLFMG